VLTGVGADEVHEAQPYHLADLLRRGRLRAAWSEARRWAEARRCGIWDLLVPFGISPVLDRGAASASAAPHAWVRPDFVRRHGLAARLIDQARPLDARCRDTHLSLTVRGLDGRAGDAIRWGVAAPLGIAVAQPFLDTRVLALGLGYRSRLTFEPHATKPILARAMGDRLPPCVANRRAKGHTDALYYLGLSRNLAFLEAMVRRSPLGDLGLTDAAPLVESLRTACLAGADGRRLHRLDLTLALILWFDQQTFSRRPPYRSTAIDGNERRGIPRGHFGKSLGSARFGNVSSASTQLA
jgi:asparagine synthase (glutamine-hydrolysing)